MSKFDRLYRRLILTGFFAKGWGDPTNLKRILEFRKIISNRDACQHLVPSDYPIHIEKEVREEKDCIRKKGYFKSPFAVHLPGVMPKEVETARFEIILPKTWKTEHHPVCLHLAGTGDHYFARRRVLMGRPLLKESGIASLLLENPFYCTRKPKQQIRSSLQNVSDLFVMGGALVLESMALFHWCEQQGYGPLGVTGISMGGHMASAAATNWHKPLSMVPCLSACSASYIFTEGVMSGSIHWKELQRQFESNSAYRNDLLDLIHSPEFNVKEEINGKSFSLGKEFVKHFGDVNEMVAFHERNISESKLQQDYSKDIQKTTEATNKRKDSNLVRNPSPKLQPDSGALSNLKLREGDEANISPGDSKNGNRLEWTLSNAKYLQQSLLAIPGKLQFTSKNDRNNKKKREVDEETVKFMRGIMDECTHLGNFSVPVDTELIIIVLAKHDAYVPTANVQSLQKIWPGADVRLVNAGHINAYLLNHDAFRKAIVDSFDRQINKYYSSPSKENAAKVAS